MPLALIGAVLLVLGVVAVLTGLLPPAAAMEVADRVWPILLFVVAITVVAELAAKAGVFDRLAELLARLGRGRAVALWGLVVALAVLATAFLSLDTTAVLLTPIVVLLARRVGLPTAPFALTTVWLANTASLFLPVSNLTNLLALDALGDASPIDFLRLLLPAALVAVLVPCVIVFVVFRKQLLQRYRPQPGEPIADRVLFVIASVVLVLLLPLLVSGLPVWIPALAAAVVLAVVYAVRKPGELRLGLVPWQLVVFAAGLFLVVEAAQNLGLPVLLNAVAGKGDDAVALLRLAGTGLVGANVVDNLPAYLALEPIAGTASRLAALLIGVNAGPLITPWASLAILLWHQRLTALGEPIRWSRVIGLGAIAAPVTVVLSTLALAASTAR